MTDCHVPCGWPADSATQNHKEEKVFKADFQPFNPDFGLIRCKEEARLFLMAVASVNRRLMPQFPHSTRVCLDNIEAV